MILAETEMLVVWMLSVVYAMFFTAFAFYVGIKVLRVNTAVQRIEHKLAGIEQRINADEEGGGEG